MPEQLSSRAILETLVAFDTTSRDSNLHLIRWVETYLAGFGIPSRLVPSDDGAKANLYATIGPMVKGGVVLSGHTDVVPVDGQPWESDPFTAVEKDGKLFGRGTSDMKAFIACSLAAVPDFLRPGLKRPVHLAFSYDEEVGCLGVHSMVERIARELPRPQAVIVGEPTEMKVVNAHKGTRSFRTIVTGRESHSSTPEKGVNAILVAMELIAILEQLGAEMRERGDPTGRFDPPHTTVHVGTITGGTAQNIVPRECIFTWEYRLIPGMEDQEIRNRFEAACSPIRARIKALAPEADIQTLVRASVPALVPHDGSPAEALVTALTGRNETLAVSYATEAGIFQDAGIPAVVCGPGNIREAHRPNEFIELSELDACDSFLNRLNARLRG